MWGFCHKAAVSKAPSCSSEMEMSFTPSVCLWAGSIFSPGLTWGVIAPSVYEAFNKYKPWVQSDLGGNRKVQCDGFRPRPQGVTILQSHFVPICLNVAASLGPLLYFIPYIYHICSTSQTDSHHDRVKEPLAQIAAASLQCSLGVWGQPYPNSCTPTTITPTKKKTKKSQESKRKQALEKKSTGSMWIKTVLPSDFCITVAAWLLRQMINLIVWMSQKF